MQDGPWTWSADLIASTVLEYMQHLRKTKNVKFDYIITFDTEGVSNHPNHNSIPHGVKALATKTPIQAEIYTLMTVNKVRQYLSFVDILYDIVFGPKNQAEYYMNFYSTSPREHIEVMRLHQSQYVWFRMLHTLFSRYVYFNKLQRMDVVRPQETGLDYDRIKKKKEEKAEAEAKRQKQKIKQ